eukprot:1181708-Prorocentrum_minimum.AAC.1
MASAVVQQCDVRRHARAIRYGAATEPAMAHRGGGSGCRPCVDDERHPAVTSRARKVPTPVPTPALPAQKKGCCVSDCPVVVMILGNP